jgi:hypothetical protein
MFGQPPTGEILSKELDRVGSSMVPRRVATAPEHEYTSAMRSLENLLQVDFHLTAWEFANVMRSLYEEIPPPPPPAPRGDDDDDDNDTTPPPPPPPHPPPAVEDWRRRRDIYNVYNAVGPTWQGHSIEVLLKKIGLSVRRVAGDDQMMDELATMSTSDVGNRFWKNAIVTIQWLSADAGGDLHAVAIVNGWLVDGTRDAVPVRCDDADIIQKIYNQSSDPDNVDVGIIDAIVVEGPLKEDPPHGRLDYDLSKLQTILHTRRHLETAPFEGFSERHPIDLTAADDAPREVAAPAPRSMFGRPTPEIDTEMLGGKSVLLPQKTAIQPHNEGTCTMRSLENLLQVSFNLTAWEFRNVLVSLYSENPPESSDPSAQEKPRPPDVFKWQERRDTLVDKQRTLGKVWGTDMINLILKKIGLEFFRLYDHKAILNEIDNLSWRGMSRGTWKYGLISIRFRGGRGSHMFPIVNGWIVDATEVNSPITRMDGIQTIYAMYGRFDFMWATMITGPMKKDPPYGRLDYDLDALQDILYSKRGIDPRFEGFSQQYPVDLTMDDDHAIRKND